MAIINVTPDSFFSGSRSFSAEKIEERVRIAVGEGADFIDLGAASSRPGADDVTFDEELRRLSLGLGVIKRIAPHIPVSIDTFRAEIARRCIIDEGADIVNDISGGSADTDMFNVVAALHVPYILMHMRGTSTSMQSLTDYPQGVTAGVIAELAPKLDRLSLLGVNDVIVDPGFGFAKTFEQNYRLLRDLQTFSMLGRPILVGMSRKSMATRLLDITPQEALNATTVLNTLAIERGASIIRVHDVRELREAITLTNHLHEA